HIFGELHQLRDADRALVERVQPDVVVFGHSHRPYRSRLGRVLLFNPGSAGPRRFSLPRTVGLLRLGPRRIDAPILHLDSGPAPPPGERGRAVAGPAGLPPGRGGAGAGPALAAGPRPDPRPPARRR